MTVIDTSVWIPLLNGVGHPKADRARAVIEGQEDVGVPGIILEEILRGLKNDAQFRRVRDLLLTAPLGLVTMPLSMAEHGGR